MLELPQCCDCVNFMDEKEGMCCLAYPNGIPTEVLYSSCKPGWDGKCSKDYEFTMVTPDSEGV